MSPESPKEIITNMPGAEPFTGQLPNREVVTIPGDQVTSQMRANAMFSPDNVRPGAFKPEASAESAQPAATEQAEAIGGTVTGSLVEVDQVSAEAGPKEAFADIWSDEEPTGSVEDAAIRPPVKPLTEGDIEAIRMQKQMDINRATSNIE